MRKLLAPYFSLQGRSSRREWWILEILIVLGFRLNELLFETMATEDGRLNLSQEASQTWLLLAASLLWLNIASNVRRLHDRGKSGWWSLFYLIPGIGQLWCFIECGFLKGQPHANRYGLPVTVGGGGAAPYQSLADQLAARLQALKTGPAVSAPAPKAATSSVLSAPLSKAAGRRVSVLAASQRPTVQRRGGFASPSGRTLRLAIVVALLLGLAALALTSGIPIPIGMAPVGVGPNAPAFEAIDQTLKP